MENRRFVTSKRGLIVRVEESRNGLCVAWEDDVVILHSWCSHWLMDTLHMRYLGEELIEDVSRNEPSD